MTSEEVEMTSEEVEMTSEEVAMTKRGGGPNDRPGSVMTAYLLNQTGLRWIPLLKTITQSLYNEWRAKFLGNNGSKAR